MSECLEACLMTSPRCAGAATSPAAADDDVIECRLYATEDQLHPTRSDVTGTDLYVIHSHCYSRGKQATDARATLTAGRPTNCPAC